jgi:selenocysteine-specific elongation factor
VLLRAGDRFVIRTSAPLNSIAGGVVTDPYAPRRARAWPAGLTPANRLARLVDDAGADGLELATLPVRLGAPPSICDELVAVHAANLVRTPTRLIARDSLDQLERILIRHVEQYHADHPLELGIPVQSLRAALAWNPEVVGRALDDLVSSSQLMHRNSFVARGGWAPTPSVSQTVLLRAVRSRLEAAGPEPPTSSELASQLGADGQGVAEVLRFLERAGDVVPVEADRYYASEQLRLLVDRLRAAMAAGGEFPPSILRESLGLSRKFLVPFLEYCDRVGHTDRRAGGRVWRKT